MEFGGYCSECGRPSFARAKSSTAFKPQVSIRFHGTRESVGMPSCSVALRQALEPRSLIRRNDGMRLISHGGFGGQSIPPRNSPLVHRRGIAMDA